MVIVTMSADEYLVLINELDSLRKRNNALQDEVEDLNVKIRCQDEAYHALQYLYEGVINPTTVNDAKKKIKEKISKLKDLPQSDPLSKEEQEYSDMIALARKDGTIPVGFPRSFDLEFN